MDKPICESLHTEVLHLLGHITDIFVECIHKHSQEAHMLGL